MTAKAKVATVSGGRASANPKSVIQKAVRFQGLSSPAVSDRLRELDGQRQTARGGELATVEVLRVRVQAEGLLIQSGDDLGQRCSDQKPDSVANASFWPA